MLNIYNFKLYYPNGDPYAGPDSGEGGGAREEPSETTDPVEATGGSTNNTTDGTNGRDPKEKEREKNERELFASVFPKSPPGYKFEKEITKFTTSKNRDNIDNDGEDRQVIVKGTPGSTFSITIVDSSGCDMLTNKVENKKIPSTGVYALNQNFPSIKLDGSDRKTKETYSLKLIAGAGVRKIGSEVDDFELDQMANPVVTITKSTSQTSPSLSVSGSDITFTGKAMSRVNAKSKLYSLTITGSDTETAESLYVKNINFRDNITGSDIIQKVVDCGGETKPELKSELVLKPLTTRTETTIEGETTISGDLEVGMKVTSLTSEEKTIVANLDKDENIIDYDCDKTLPVKHKLNNTNDLDVGMRVKGNVISGTTIKSIDCDTKITLSPQQVIPKDTIIRFEREFESHIEEIIDNVNSKGNAVIRLTKGVVVKDNTILDFSDNNTNMHGEMSFSASGVDSIVLKTFIKPIRFGDKNITYTLNLDNIITSKPNAYSRSAKTAKNTAVVINMIKGDNDSNASTKTGTVTGNPSHGTVGAYNTSTDSFTYTPNNEFTGKDEFKFTMSDGVNSSDEKTVFITVK
tara:strand:- start:656 stop:2386 length:1731 start_codon:yes stop_codon:yes gene_type:complete